jgi:hypothetical protein
VSDLPNDALVDWQSFSVEQSGASGGHCDCCGSTTKRIWGFIHRDGATVAAYFVGWAEQCPDHGTSFDLILGMWGAATTKQDRYAVALEYRIVEGSPQFMVVDAQGRLTSDQDIAGFALKRSEIIGTPLAPRVFALIDAIYIGDPRLDEIRTWQ